MVWHYNAFLSYDVKPVEEQRVWLDEDTANQTQVDVNAFFLQNGIPSEDEIVEQMKLAESLYANARVLWEEPVQVGSLDRRA